MRFLTKSFTIPAEACQIGQARNRDDYVPASVRFWDYILPSVQEIRHGDIRDVAVADDSGSR